MLRQVMMNRAFLPVRTTRRAFLIGATAIAGGFAVGFRPAGALAQEGTPASQADAAPVNPFAAYVTITNDDRITVISSQFDMGEGSYHGIATLVLEELGGRWDQTDVVGGVGDPKLYGNLAVGGALPVHRRLDLDDIVVGPLSPGGRHRPGDAGRRGGRAVGRGCRRDHGRRRQGDASDRREPRLRRARRARGGDAGAGRGAAEGAGAVDADRQRRRPPLRRARRRPTGPTPSPST